MEDWKAALGALTGYNDSTENEEQETQTSPKESKVERKKRMGVVYSTNPDYAYTDSTEEEAETLPKNQQKLRLNMERAGRGGKTVTIVRGFIGSCDDLAQLCKLLKQKCGVGGTVKEGEIIIQGDHWNRLTEILRAEGYTQTR